VWDLNCWGSCHHSFWSGRQGKDYHYVFPYYHHHREYHHHLNHAAPKGFLSSHYVSCSENHRIEKIPAIKTHTFKIINFLNLCSLLSIKTPHPPSRNLILREDVWLFLRLIFIVHLHISYITSLYDITRNEPSWSCMHSHCDFNRLAGSGEKEGTVNHRNLSSKTGLSPITWDLSRSTGQTQQGGDTNGKNQK